VVVWLWTVVPLAALHLLWWRRSRELLRFQIVLDIVLAVVIGPALVLGADLFPVRCLSRNQPFTEWQWSEASSYQPAQSDIVLQIHPWWEEARRQLVDGKLPLINERAGGGMPLLANGQIGLFSPTMLPVWMLGPERGTTVMALWKIELAALGAFFFLRRSPRLALWPAVLGAVAYGGGSYQVAWLLSPLSTVTAVLPWLWWWVAVLLRGTGGLAHVVGFGLCSGWLMGSGVNPETAAIVVGSSLVAGLVLHPRRWRRLAVACLLASTVTVILAWPTLAAIGASAKAEVMRDGRLNRSPPPVAVRAAAARQMLVPTVHGHPGRGDWSAPYPYPSAAMGIGGAALGLIALGCVRRRHRRLWWAAMACLAVAAVLAYRVPPLDWPLVRIPPFDRMTLPRFAALVPWSLSVLAALAADGLQRGARRWTGWAVLAAGGLAATAFTGRPWSLTPTSGALVLATVLACASVALLARRPAWLPVLVAVELALYAVGVNPTADPKDRVPRPPLVNRLVELQAAQGGRIVGLGGVLPPNLAGRYGLPDLRAYDPMRPAPFAEMFSRLGEPEPVLGGALQRAPAGLSGAWSVRFLVTPPDRNPPGWTRVWSDSSGSIWSNPEWLPEIRLVGRVQRAGDEAGWRRLTAETLDFASEAVVPEGTPVIRSADVAIDVVETSGTRITAETRCDGTGLVVVARPWAPGWRAEIDGHSAPIVRANLAGLGVVVPPGEHRVELSYQPWRW
jgi:hypothetical protein